MESIDSLHTTPLLDELPRGTQACLGLIFTVNVVNSLTTRHYFDIRPIILFVLRDSTHYQDAPLILNNTILSKVKFTKLIGILIDENLSWNDHISSLCCTKVSKLFLLQKKTIRNIHGAGYLEHIPIVCHIKYCITWRYKNFYWLSVLIMFKF